MFTKTLIVLPSFRQCKLIWQLWRRVHRIASHFSSLFLLCSFLGINAYHWEIGTLDRVRFGWTIMCVFTIALQIIVYAQAWNVQLSYRMNVFILPLHFCLNNSLRVRSALLLLFFVFTFKVLMLLLNLSFFSDFILKEAKLRYSIDISSESSSSWPELDAFWIIMSKHLFCFRKEVYCSKS